jgi:hypothetical protein
MKPVANGYRREAVGPEVVPRTETIAGARGYEFPEVLIG